MGVWGAVGSQGLELPELTHLAETLSRLVRGIWEMRGTVCVCVCVSMCEREKEKECERERERLDKFSVLSSVFQPRGYSLPFPQRGFLTPGLAPMASMVCWHYPTLLFDRVCFGQGVLSLAAVEYLRLEIIQYKLFSLDLMKIRSWQVKLFSLDW